MSKPKGPQIGQSYGGSRPPAGGRKSRVREWEWVHVGPEFALSHPMARVRGGMICVIGFLMLHSFGMLVVLWSSLTAFVFLDLSLIALTAIVHNCFSMRAILRREKEASYMVWIALFLSFPISLPLMLYWADGVRPNLIYRYRFERLVPETEAASDV